MRISKTLVFILAAAAAAALWAQSRGEASATIGGKQISIDYGRPNLHGRTDPQNELPDGGVWRLGMNDATELETEADLKFGDVTIPAGHYSLFARKVSTDDWELLVNEQTGQWGTQHDPSQDLASIPLQIKSNRNPVEKFTIEITPKGDDGGTISFAWGKSTLLASFTVG